jgi:hypothetical protein
MPQPAPVPVAVPAFDVAGFYDRARRIMRERVDLLSVERDKDLKKNLVAMEREYKRMIRKIPEPETRKNAEEHLDTLIESCESSGNRVPKELIQGMSDLEQVKAIHEEYLGKQKAIDQTLVDEVVKLSTSYLQGLQKQVDRLIADKDQAAIELIGEEISKVSQDVGYFPLLMLGEEDPAISKPPPPKDGKEEKE